MLEDLLKLLNQGSAESANLSEVEKSEIINKILSSSPSGSEILQQLNAKGFSNEQINNSLNSLLGSTADIQQINQILNLGIGDLKDPFPLPPES